MEFSSSWYKNILFKEAYSIWIFENLSVQLMPPLKADLSVESTEGGIFCFPINIFTLSSHFGLGIEKKKTQSLSLLAGCA